MTDLKAKMQVVIDFAAAKARSFRDTANEEVVRSRMAMIVLIAAALLLSFGVALLITRSITPPLRLIVRRMKDIAQGDLSYDVEIDQKDEIGELAESFREMQVSLRNKAEVAAAIAAGDFSQMVEIRGGNDQLGKAINAMTSSLHKSKTESDLRDWVKTGKNELNKIIVGQNDIQTLAGEVISFLAGRIRRRPK